jgi:hypothetical protein
VYPGAYHAWNLGGPEAAKSLRMNEERIAALRTALHPEVARV